MIGSIDKKWLYGLLLFGGLTFYMVVRAGGQVLENLGLAGISMPVNVMRLETNAEDAEVPAAAESGEAEVEKEVVYSSPELAEAMRLLKDRLARGEELTSAQVLAEEEGDESAGYRLSGEYDIVQADAIRSINEISSLYSQGKATDEEYQAVIDAVERMIESHNRRVR